jgi:single-stranded-DNA-specific exonuclease
VASRIAERYHRPAVLIALDGDEGSGSGRSIPGFDLLAGLTAASDDLERYGGHRAAAGLTIAAGRVEAFREAFCAHAAATLRPEDLVRRERIDAIVPGDALDLGLAEELARLEPFGAGNPPVSLLVPAALCDDPRPMAEGKHVAFTLHAGGARSRCVSFGRGASLPAEPGCPVDAAVRLEVNRYNGAVEPRLVLRHAAEPASRPGDRCSASPSPSPPGCSPSSTATPRPPPESGPTLRQVHDRRGGGVAGLVAGLVATGEPVLVVAAHAGQRAPRARRPGRGLRARRARRLGAVIAPWPRGTTTSWCSTRPCGPGRPPARAICTSYGGEAERRFARRVHVWNHDLRDALAATYRAIRAAGRADGPALEALLRGDGPQPRSPALAGRLVLVLSELGLVTFDRSGPALAVTEATARTELERSPAYRAHQAVLEAGLAHLDGRVPAPAAA